jgi:uncharacterized protein YaiE (UPF0345 family)
VSSSVGVMSLARWDRALAQGCAYREPNKGTTDIRHQRFEDWKSYLAVEHRFPVPFNAFAEPI